MASKSLATLLVCLCIYLPCLSQDNAPIIDRITDLPDKFFNKINSATASLEYDLDRQTERYLRNFLNTEKKLRKKLRRSDSSAAADLGNAENQYEQLTARLRKMSSEQLGPDQHYIPYLDTLKSSLSFLDQHNGLFPGSGEIQKKAQSSIQQVKRLQLGLQQSEQVKVFIRQRRENIMRILSRYTKPPGSLSKVYAEFNKELYYYSQQVKEYKEMLNNPDKLTRKGLDVLSRTKLFRDFMHKHSELAGLFNLPSGASPSQAMPGLQTSMQVQQLIQNQLSAGGSNARQVVQQNMQAAQQQLNALKDKINNAGGGSSGDIDNELPDFKPNNQKTKNFLQRLELGTNLQSAKSNSFFPSTTDLGLSIGYKLTGNSVIGIGGSYKVGWGKDIRHIVVSSEGAGLRSFLDVKIKGGFFASGGFEYNYQGFAKPDSVLTNMPGNFWTRSGLVGISKIISLQTKFFKKTKMQLLWDFLSYQQMPRTQALKFRVGYNF